MAAITCDICGGTLSMDASGDFALCDSCGMKHTKDRIKTKAQEVTGTVAVSNIAGIESLMKRGNLALEDGKWREANDFFDKVLDIDAEYAPAYIGKLCSELEFTNEAMLSKRLLLTNYPNYQKALRFAKEEYLAKIKTYDRLNREYFITKKQQFENIQKQISGKEPFAILPQSGTVSVRGKEHTITLAADGSVKGNGCQMELRPAQRYDPGSMIRASSTKHGYAPLYEYKGYKRDEFFSDKIYNWFNSASHIFAVATSDYHIVLLETDEKVKAYGRNDHKQCEIDNWRDIVAISAGDRFSIGLKEDGTIAAAGNYPEYITQWKDIVMIYASGEFVVGLKSDDTFVAAGQGFNISGSEEQIIAKLQAKRIELEQERKEKEERKRKEKEERELLIEQERKAKEERELLEKQRIERERKEEEFRLKRKEKKKKIFWTIFCGIIGGFVFMLAASINSTNAGDALGGIIALGCPLIGLIVGGFWGFGRGSGFFGTLFKIIIGAIIGAIAGAIIGAIAGAIIGTVAGILAPLIPKIAFGAIGVCVGALIGYLCYLIRRLFDT